MEKINLVELLKDCPEGMELDCTMYEDVCFYKITDNPVVPICLKRIDGAAITLTKYGGYADSPSAKCVIFPKGKTTWEGFQRPFKDGDVVCYSDCIAIFKEWGDETLFRTHVTAYLHGDSTIDVAIPLFGKAIRREARFATEEEKQKLFQAIKANGYEWDNVTKVLYKIVEPMFKVGDIIQDKWNLKWKIIDVGSHYYKVSLVLTDTSKLLEIKAQDDYELVPNKFDINTLKPFDKVLVRDFDNTPWEIEFFSRLLDGKHFRCFELSYVQCIPYEGNEHLLGKKDDCDEFFRTWEKTGD